MDFPKNIKAVIFDFDGTLFNLDVDWRALSHTLEKKFGTSSLSDTGSFAGDKNKAILALIGKFERLGVLNGQPIRGAAELLNQLSSRYKIAIVSRNNRSTIIAGLKKLGFENTDIIVAREDVERAKPHPEPLQLAANKLKLRLNGIIMVGDTYHDVEMAQAAGAYVIVVENPKIAFVPKGADQYIKNLAQLDTLLELNGSSDGRH